MSKSNTDIFNELESAMSEDETFQDIALDKEENQDILRLCRIVEEVQESKGIVYFTST